MLRIAILDDDDSLITRLVHQLTLTGFPCKFLSLCSDPGDAYRWIRSHTTGVDLLFLDMNLAASLSAKPELEIYTPVVLMSDHEHAFFHCPVFNAIDYLVRPVTSEALTRALNRFNRLKSHFNNNNDTLPTLNGNGHMHYKERIIVKKGSDYQSIRTENVACFFTDQKLVFLVDKEGKKYLTDIDNLSELALKLDRKVFFRANRKYIININFIKKYRTCDRVKLEVELSLQNPETVMISQENSGCFRQWIENL